MVCLVNRSNMYLAILVDTTVMPEFVVTVVVGFLVLAF